MNQLVFKNKIKQRIGIKKWLNTLKRKRYQQALRRRQLEINSKDKRLTKSRKKRKKTVIDFPSSITLYKVNSRRALLASLQQMHHAFDKGQRIHLNLSKITSLSPCGTIKLVSEIHSLLKDEEIIITCNLPRGRTKREMLEHLGVVKWLRQRRMGHLNNQKRVKDWLFFQGNKLNDISFSDLKPRINTVLNNPSLTDDLIGSVKEAIINVIDHAYQTSSDMTEAPDQTPWYIFAQVRDNSIRMAVCDRGFGIPRSMRTTHSKYLQLAFSASDHLGLTINHKLITAALEYGKSRTKEENRGKGFTMMQETVKNSTNGFLAIYSDKGLVRMNKHQVIESEDYDSTMNGTIILWDFGINQNGK